MWLIFVLFSFATVSSSNGSQLVHGESTILNELIHTVQLEHWSTEEEPCVEKVQAILENLKNFTLWANWILNANSLPGGNLYGSLAEYGNFYQCMNPPWLASHPQFRTQHCITDVKLTDGPKNKASFDPYGSTEDILNAPTPSGLPLNRIMWGLCLPASCNPHSVAKIAKVLYHKFSFGTISPNVTVMSCQEAGVKQQYGTGFYLFMVLMASLLTIALASTYHQSHVSSEHQQPDSLKKIIFKSFCISKNLQDLIKENKEEIKVMNGMRFITALALVIAHVLLHKIMFGFANARELEKDMGGSFGLFLHFDIAVDTFLALSGLLHIKGLLANAHRQNLLLVLWKRYLRLIGPFAVILFYLISVSKYTGSGPFWTIGNNFETDACHKNWNLSLLMLNSNIKDVCHIVSWYIACDYQLTILGTIIFFFYQKDKKFGLAAFGTAAIFSVVIPAALTYWYNLPALHFLDFSKILVYNTRHNWELSCTYMASYCRASTYLVGIALGYFMSVYRPAEYRNTVSTRWSIIGTAACLIVMLSMLALGPFYWGRKYNPIEAAIVMPTHRIAWAAAVCCIIALCEYGTVPLVTEFLGMSIFTPVSRLCYGIYLIHPIVVQRNIFVVNSPETFDVFSMFITVSGTMALLFSFSFIMWLLVEAPVINLCNHFLLTKPKSRELIKNKSTAGNGIMQNENGHGKHKTL